MLTNVLKVLSNGRPYAETRRRWRTYSCGLPLKITGTTENRTASRRRRFYTQTKPRAQRSTTPVSAPSMAASASISQDVVDYAIEDYYDEYEMKEIEKITQECLAGLMPRYHDTSSTHYSPSSLDLELGEDTTVWDDPWETQQEAAAFELDEPFEVEESEPPQKQQQLSTVDLLANFDPLKPPASGNLQEMQLWLECEAQQEAVSRYQAVVDSARDREDYSSLSDVQRQVLHWFPALRQGYEQLQKAYISRETSHLRGAKQFGPLLCALPPEKLAVIVAHEAITFLLMRGGKEGKKDVTFTAMALRLAKAVEEEVLIHRVLHKRFKEAQTRTLDDDKKDTNEWPNETIEQHQPIAEEIDTAALDVHVAHKWVYASSHLENYLNEISRHELSPRRRHLVKRAVRKARNVLGKDVEWSSGLKVQLGSVLFKVLLEEAKLQDGDEMGFLYEKRWLRMDRLQAFVRLNDRLQKRFASDSTQSFAAITTRHKPMLLPPKPWTKPDEGGYLWLRVDLMRYHGCKTQKEALENGDLSTVYDGLNALGRVPWRINRRILDVAQRCYENNIPVGDVPSRDDFELPPKPEELERPSQKFQKGTPEYKQYGEEIRKYSEAMGKYNRIKQKNYDLRSLRCSAELKLDQAEKFKDFGKVYFPYNVDFRGRAYPCPPHLSNVGSDLCRGMLTFAEAKPLGPRGLYWLKVHLANLAGKDKMTFADRAAFADENMDKIRECVQDPFAGERWWLTLEDPFQGLATCYEIVNAIDSGDPESYMCSLPVHMDGSCNGLQHYAALGRDLVGGKAVNLCAMDEPQDVYVGVMHEVIRRVAEEAARTLDFEGVDVDELTSKQKKELKNNRAAKLVNGIIDRGVVKRTVMTSVYGVTYIGARNQIQEKIESKLEEKGYDIDEISREMFQASGYLAKLTMDVMGDLFTGARETMNWLTTCARMITLHGYPVAWTTPIGLPAIQPYRQKKSKCIVTLLQQVTLVEDSDDLPINKRRQVTAFPPNYVHSLDSSHMLLTALEMDRRGLTFSAVHDSFWTHACDIDEMNGVLRDTFVDLYDRPLLEELKICWEMRYPQLELPELPQKGGLDLNEVKDSRYFFQ